jgi:hypothetical protein
MSMTHLRGLIVALALAVASAGLVAPPAQAATPAAAGVHSGNQVASADRAKSSKPKPTDNFVVESVEVDGHWWGTSVRFSKAETDYIAAGYGFCAAFLATKVGAWARVLAGGCSALAVLASTLRARGYCLGANVIGNVYYTPWAWNC